MEEDEEPSEPREDGALVEEEEEELIQTRRSHASADKPVHDANVEGVRAGGGSPLSESVQSFFGPRFGYDFSGVRVHTSDQAAHSARAVNALAYTAGRDVVFGAGQYSPDTESGRRLLAHELTHVVQQGSGAQRSPDVAAVHQQGKSETVSAKAARAVQPVQVREAAGLGLARKVKPPVMLEGVSLDPTEYAISAEHAETMSVEELRKAIEAVDEKRNQLVHAPEVYDLLDENWKVLNEALERKLAEETLETSDLEWEEEEGEELQRTGIIEYDGHGKSVKDVALRPIPSTSSTEIKRLPVNTRVYVDHEMEGEMEGAKGKWYYVILEDGSYGYVAKKYVNTELPEPNATLHRIQPGEGALKIVQKYYKGDAIEWGQDERFYVNVLVLVNQETDRKGISKPREDADWDETKTIAGRQIWIPSVEFAKGLRGVVSSGSISYEAWQTIKDVAVGNIAFSAGVLHGALMSIVDLFVGIYDIIKLAWDIGKSLVTGEIITDAKKLFDDIASLKYEDVKNALLGWLDDKWNNPNTWDRWHFRGYVVGYIIMEIVMMFFSGGIATAVKAAGKGAKIAKLIAKFPTVIKMLKAAEAVAKTRVDDIAKLGKAIKGIKALSAAHEWASRVLRIPYKILVDISDEAAERLKKLPNWARERFADLNHAAMRLRLGCASPCKVDVLEIEKYLRETAEAGLKATKLVDPDKAKFIKNIIAALPADINKTKILAKLKTRPALLKAIEKADLTDTDFGKLAAFLSDADKASPDAAYRTFVRYVTNVVPAKTKGDLTKFNDIAAELIKADPRQGAALKGSMFELFAKLNVPELGGKNFKKVRFVRKGLGKSSRSADNFVPDTGELWDMKHSLSKVPKDQADAYAKIVGTKTPDGDEVKSINYLFPSEDAARKSLYLKTDYGFRVHYIGADKKLITL
jgi:hypothetical protein